MAILTDLPNELLLAIIADVSPLYIESFVLTCKRIYGLRSDTIAELVAVRSRYPSRSGTCQDVKFLRCAFQNPRVALYPMRWDFDTREHWDNSVPEDLSAAINFQIQQSPYTNLLKTYDSTNNARDLVVPLLITRLLNLRKISISFFRHHLLETVSQIVEASHDPALSLREPLALGRLTEVDIATLGHSIPGMDLAVLFAMIPTLRKLSVTNLNHLAGSESYSCQHQFHHSEVTDMRLDGYVDSEFLIELIRRTCRLQKFKYTHWIPWTRAKIESWLLIESLKQHAGDSLLYLSLLTGHIHPSDENRNFFRNYDDLSLGSLRGFTVLKSVVTCIDMFIKTRGHSKLEKGNVTMFMAGTGTVQRLISWLPASLEILVLHQGLEYWDKDTLRLLFRGLRTNKQRRIPNLRFINFVDFPDFDGVMPQDIKNACWEMGIKIGYTTHWKEGCPDCFPRYDDASNWEGCGWIELLEECCQCRRSVEC